MRQYSKVSTSIWGSRKFRDLPTDRDRLFFHYCLTCRHQNSAGIFLLPDEYAQADLYWTLDEVKHSREAVIASGLIHYDKDTREVFVDSWFRFNPACNNRHATGISKNIEDAMSDSLRELAQVQFDEAELARQKDKSNKALARQRTELKQSHLYPGRNNCKSTDYMNAMLGGLKND